MGQKGGILKREKRGRNTVEERQERDTKEGKKGEGEIREGKTREV